MRFKLAEHPSGQRYHEGPCDNCQASVTRWPGESDVQCLQCGAWYNAFGQRLRDDWRSNPSNYDEEIGDLEGFEIGQLQQEGPDDDRG